ncbi:aspartyl protease family At5g10770-like [Olea europaea subsp. europaea]|uniref:Aspartyl protease family At5g10770-like n=1 Tax=Olea europaea subsp. europaea TaxID=158383 RepID=A0A8S0PYX3_OLEEU|nr:aspartyl protease family At5g10770-like [Olea europaea subsp. europaea]
MASLISSPLFNFLLISFSFLSFLLIRSHAFEGRRAIESHYHTVEISSLLPASVCSPSTKGHSKRPSTLKVFHRHGPCSKHSQDNATPSLDEILTHDQSRVDSIQHKINLNAEMDKVKDKKAALPVQSGRALGSGNYIVTLGLGTPKKSLSLIFDTGSDLTWTQCQPCARVCYKQQDPIFNPIASTTYSNVSCSSTRCSQLSTTTGNDPSCSTKTCVYGIQYGDQSFSIGFFSQDTLTISSSDLVPKFYFGCGQNNQGLFGNTAGLLGLGRDSLSFVSQTAQRYGKYFSYCLPSSSSSTGHLTFGKSGVSSNVKFTPFAASRGTSFYFIDIVGISVGMTQLSIRPSVFKTPGTIIDSGTVITRLPPAAYKALSTEFKKQMKKYPSVPAYSILDTCYDLSKYTTISIPKISFTFGGNVKVDLAPSGILIVINSSRVCLAFAANSDASDVGILGNVQQTTLEVVYDVAGGKLGFAPGGC